jgi:sugar lactone lactonase YvrE
MIVGPNGDLYFTDSSFSLPFPSDAVKKWTAATGQLTTLIPGLTSPQGIALDAAGNVYFSHSVSPYAEWPYNLASWTGLRGRTSAYDLACSLT